MILAIDPGKKAGWAAYTQGEYQGSATIDGDSVKAVSSMIDYWQPDTLVLEDQFFRPRQLKGIKTLLRRRFIWEVLAEHLGVESIEIVEASKWQAHFRVRPGDKLAIQKLARTLTGNEVEPDEADAILIGEWFISEQQRREVFG